MVDQNLRKLPPSWRWEVPFALLISWLDREVWLDPQLATLPRQFSDSTWILHSQFYRPANAASDPVVDPKFSTFNFKPRPPEDWQRVRWHEHAKNEGALLQGAAFDGVGVPPCFRWNGILAWNQGPMYDSKLTGAADEVYSVSEDTLDEFDLAALLEIALKYTETRRAWGTFSFADVYTYLGPTDSRYGPQMGFSFDLQWLISDMLNPVENDSTPEFWWPEDRSWLVWTGRDLNGTKVFGTAEMITELRASEILETIDWHP